MVNLIQILEYNLIFDDEKPKDYKDYIVGTDKSTLLKAACFFSSLAIQPPDNRELLCNWFQKGNQDFLTEVYSKVQKIEKDKKIGILNVYSSLFLFELILKYWHESENIKSEIDSEKDLFKLYLLINEEYTSKDKVVSESTNNLDKKCRYEAMSFANSFIDSDFINYQLNKSIITQFYKAFLLFAELESHNEYNELISQFCSDYDVKDWKEYLYKVLPLIFPTIKKASIGHLELSVEQNENFEKNCTFLEKFGFNQTDVMEDDVDFIEIRNKPLYIVERGKYIIINDLILSESVFKGLYFKFKRINDSLSTPILGLKSKIGDVFSECRLVYHVLDYAFKDRYLKYSGRELHKAGINAEPDYYIRNRNKVLLFESKDIYIPASVKTSGNFKDIRKTLRTRLYFDVDKKKKKIKPKAVLQIINSIEKLLTEKEFVSLDTELKGKHLNIYPVLILHDNMYNSLGFNRLLNYWFDIELLKLQKKGINISKVRPLIMIDVDTLIFVQESLKDSMCSLDKFIDDYINDVLKINFKKARTKEQAMAILQNSTISFSMYLQSDNIIKKNWKIPTHFEIFGKEIISPADNTQYSQKGFQ